MKSFIQIYRKSVVIFLIILACFVVQSTVFASHVERVSLDNLGAESDENNYRPVVSTDGRYVVFESPATNLVSGDNNAVSDIFVYDRDTDTIERVSVDDNGNEGDMDSFYPHISPDGRYVTFYSEATNLVPGDTNNSFDTFLYDRNTDTIERVSVDDNGNEGNSDSFESTVSADGRFVTFESNASNLVAGDTNGVNDIFVYDRDTDTIERVSVDDNGNETSGDSIQPSISTDGRYVAFASHATDLVSGDTNTSPDVFVYDRDTDTIERVSVDDNGNEGNGGSASAVFISSLGRYVVFTSPATDLVAGDTNGVNDIFVYDRDTDAIERVSVDDNGNEGNGGSSEPSISSDGRYVIFTSFSSNFIAGDTNSTFDVFIYDLYTHTIEIASSDDLGNEGNAGSIHSSISSDGRYAVFDSTASNLVAGDTNGLADIFIISRNVPPSDISLSDSEIEEKESPNTVVATIMATDVNEDDVNTFSFSCTAPGIDDSSFNISGDTLYSSVYFDYDIKSSYSICIRATDSEMTTYDKNFTITITNVTESSSGSLARGSKNTRQSQVLNSKILDDSSMEISKNCHIFTSRMARGSLGGEVSVLQNSLNVIGFNTGMVDGIFGPITDNGVRAFQKAKNLLVDGIVGPMTRGALNMLCGE